MGVRYRVDDLPNTGAAAFTPLPARNHVASSYGLVHVMGAPGTLAVPAPATPAVPSQTATVGAVARDGRYSAQGSDVSPDVILPAIYIALADNMGPEDDTGIGMVRRRLNELPVRAVDPGRKPVPVWMQFPAGGKQIPQPRQFVRWPSRIQNPGR